MDYPHVKVEQILHLKTREEALAWFREVAQRCENKGDDRNMHYWWCCIYLLGETP